MTWQGLLAVVGGFGLLILAAFQAGKQKGKKAEQLDRAEDDFNDVKEDADAALEEQMGMSAVDRFNAALRAARERLARRDNP